jgi:hypothetical protein
VSTTTFPPADAATTAVIPAYLYEQYFDDQNLQAFIASYNEFAGTYLDWFNDINLPVYTGPLIAGALLDWVAQGLYGISRPALGYTTFRYVGPFNTWALNTIPFNGRTTTGTSMLYLVTDDVFKRIITWNFYKGDGFRFNVRWLKRRVMRFLGGMNGTDFNISQTYQVSVAYTAIKEITITITNGTAPLTDANILRIAIISDVLNLPFQFTFVIVVDTSTHLVNDGGVLIVTPGPTITYPLTSGGPAGSIWSNGGVVSVVPGITPDPLAPPVYFYDTDAFSLQALGGGNLPIIAPTAGTQQLWNIGGEVWVA